MYGVIDIGSNTIRLSVYKKTDLEFKLMFNKKNVAGLAGYVDEDGCLSKGGIDKAIEVLTGFSQLLENIEIKDIYVFATASLRNISNSKQATMTISAATGFKIEVLSGKQEATYDFIGATCFTQLDEGMMVDVGGGSTELVFYSEGKIDKTISFPIGSLNLYTKYVSDILPSKIEMSTITQRVEKELSSFCGDENAPVICGIGGTARNACKLSNEIFNRNTSNRIFKTMQLNNILLDFSENRKLAERTIIRVAPDRIHTLIPGMIVLNGIAAKFGSEFIQVSEHGIREGYLYSKLFLTGEKG